MLKHLTGLVIIFNLAGTVLSQNGLSLNKTVQFLNIPDEDIGNHYSLITFQKLHGTSDTLKSLLITDLMPIATAEFLYNNPEKNLFITREGISGQMHYKKILKGSLTAYHEMDLFPEKLKSDVDSFQSVPKNGFKFNTIENVYSMINFRGNLSYMPYDFLSFQLGIDKHFFGNGYRSLFLSDNSAAYPYFTASLKIWHIQYISMTAFFRDIYYNKNMVPDYKQKYGTFHYLSWNITPTVNLNLFETVLWRKADSSLYNGLNINYLNPVIFMRPVEQAQGSTDNVLMGIGLNASVYKNILFYSQFILDEFYASEFFKKTGFFTNKFGYQIGIKDNASFHKNFKWLIEYNWVRPYTYSHYTTLQAYGNVKQPLAHPLGANFKETTGLIFYSKNNVYFSTRFSYSCFGKDSLKSNYGNNIYNNFWDVDDLYGHYILQGIKVSEYNLILKTGYIVKPDWNLTIEAGLIWQKEKTEIDPADFTYYFIGIKSLLYNDDWFD